MGLGQEPPDPHHPRAEIYTSGDVTVEELRGEKTSRRLTAEALAARLDDARRTDDDELSSLTRVVRQASRDPKPRPVGAFPYRGRARIAPGSTACANRGLLRSSS